MSENIEIKMPSEQQEGTESMVSSWLKKVGDVIKEHEPVVEINTDKVTMEISSPATGTLVKIIKNENDKIEPGEVLGFIQPGEVKVVKKENVKAEATSSLDTSSSSQELTPAVRRLIKEKGIDASKITGTGPNGRILVEDVEKYCGFSSSKRTPHSAMRKSIANHMVQSLLKTAPHVTTIFDCDLSKVIAHRDKLNKELSAKGKKISFTPYFVKGCVAALKVMPELNSKWHDDGLELFDECNIGIATSLPEGGLIVPVIKNCEKLELIDIADKLEELTSKARGGTLESKDVQGGTFTISNHGMTGSLIATPIINQPQSGILGIGKLEKRVVVSKNDEMQIKPMVYVTLTFDHRVIDGVDGNKFLAEFVRVLESF